MVEMTEEQKKFLEECENEFKDRYTENEGEFMIVKNMKLKKPPIIDPWHSRFRDRPPHFRNNDRRRNNWRRYNNERGERYRNERGNRYESHFRPY